MSSDILREIADKLDQIEKNQKNEIGNLQKEMSEGFAKMNEQLNTEVNNLRSDMSDGFAKVDGRLNTEVNSLRSDMSDGFAKVDMRLNKVQTLIEGIAFGIAERIGNEAEFSYRLQVLEQQMKELQQKLEQRQ